MCYVCQNVDLRNVLCSLNLRLVEKPMTYHPPNKTLTPRPASISSLCLHGWRTPNLLNMAQIRAHWQLYYDKWRSKLREIYCQLSLLFDPFRVQHGNRLNNLSRIIHAHIYIYIIHTHVHISIHVKYRLSRTSEWNSP